jgi:hypothetical protein
MLYVFEKKSYLQVYEKILEYSGDTPFLYSIMGVQLTSRCAAALSRPFVAFFLYIISNRLLDNVCYITIPVEQISTSTYFFSRNIG